MWRVWVEILKGISCLLLSLEFLLVKAHSMSVSLLPAHGLTMIMDGLNAENWAGDHMVCRGLESAGYQDYNGCMSGFLALLAINARLGFYCRDYDRQRIRVTSSSAEAHPLIVRALMADHPDSSCQVVWSLPLLLRPARANQSSRRRCHFRKNLQFSQELQTPSIQMLTMTIWISYWSDCWFNLITCVLHQEKLVSTLAAANDSGSPASQVWAYSLKTHLDELTYQQACVLCPNHCSTDHYQVEGWYAVWYCLAK